MKYTISYCQEDGHAYFIDKDELTVISDREVSKNQKATIDASVQKTINEYGETLRLLKKYLVSGTSDLL